MKKAPSQSGQGGGSAQSFQIHQKLGGHQAPASRRKAFMAGGPMRATTSGTNRPTSLIKKVQKKKEQKEKFSGGPRSHIEEIRREKS